jgi:hypothetical protein
MKAAQNLAKSARKHFTLQDLIRHEKIKHKNLVEMLSEYPNQGVGFRIAKVYWPENHYVKVFKVEFDTNRSGKVYGRKYVDGVASSDKIFEVDRTTSRGLWRYDLGDSFHQTDNGLIYSLEDLNKHFVTVSQRPWKRPADLRVNMQWTAPEGAQEPLENENASRTR